MDESPGITRSIIPSYQNTTAASTTSALSAKFSKTTQTTSQQKEATASEAKSTTPSSSNMMLSDDQIRSEGIDMPNTHETPEEALANLVNSEPMTQDSHTDKRLRDLVNRFGGVDGLEKQLELASRRILNKKSRLNSHRAQPGTSHQSASTPYGIDLNPVPTLDQFLTNSAPWWNAITIRLQHRWSMLVNSIAYATREKTLVMEQMRVLQEACAQMDLDYLILFQTYAILILPGVSVAKQDRVIEEAMLCLRGVFQAAENDDSCWFAGFPCATETDVESLRKWMSRASGLLNTFVAHLQAMVDTHQRQLTFPLRDELHAGYPYSTFLQDTLVTALLVHVWPLPLDVCLSKVLEAYKIAQVNRVSMVQNSPTVLHQTLSGSEDTRLMTAINSYSREHMDHSAFPTAINPMMQPLQWQTIASAPSAQIANLIRSLTTQTNALRQTSMIASMEASDQLPQHWTTTGLIQQNLNNGHVTFQSGLPMYNIQQVTPPILPNYFLPNAENIWQVSQGTYPCVPPEEQALLSLPTLPQVSPGYHSGSETVYHMQLAYPIDPISIVQCTGSQSEIDFRTHVTSFLCMPWRFGVATISKDVTFELSEEGLSKLAKEIPDAMGGHPIRPVKSGTQSIRLRGVRGRPKTLSEFVATKTHWPISMVILLNGQPVELRRKPESPSNMAVDVSSRLHLGTNVLKICFRWPNPAPKKFCYLLALEIVEVAHITDMKAMVSPNDIEVAENLLRSRFQGGDDDEDQMMLDQVDITITDPYTSKILDTPVKSIHCTHLQCFDLDVFLHSRPKDLNTTKEFICPFCDKDARPESLKIDSWMSRVIQEVKERNRYDAKVITVTPDLRWIIKGDDLIGKSKNGTGTRGNGRSKESKGKIVEVIELE